MNIWVILIIVFVILIFVTIGIVLLIFFLKKKNKNDLPKNPDEDPVENPDEDPVENPEDEIPEDEIPEDEIPEDEIPEDDEEEPTIPIPPANKCPNIENLTCVLQTVNDVQYPTYPFTSGRIICPYEQVTILIIVPSIGPTAPSLSLTYSSNYDLQIFWSYSSGAIIFPNKNYNMSNNDVDKITCYPKPIPNTWLFDGYQIWDSVSLKVLYLDGSVVGLRDSTVEYGVSPKLTSGVIIVDDISQ